MHGAGKVQALRRPEKTLNVYLRLILRTKTACNNKQTASPGEGEESDFQAYHFIILKCPVFSKKGKLYKETGTYSPFKGKK